MSSLPLRVFSGNRLEGLAEGFAHALATDPLALHETETVLVPDYGVARLLTRLLADRLGVAAQISFATPEDFLERLLLGLHGSPDKPPPPLTWRIFAALDQDSARATWRLEDDASGLARFDLARRLARNLREATWHRPDRLATAANPGAEEGPEVIALLGLWQKLREDHPEEVFAGLDLSAEIEAIPAETGPRRVHAFGLSAVSPIVFGGLQALAQTRPVALWLVLPSPHWLGGIPSEPGDRDAGDDEPDMPALWREFGDRSRGLFRACTQDDEAGDRVEPVAFAEDAPATLLGQIQNQLLEMEPAPEPYAWTSDDRSLRVHVAPTLHREAEVIAGELVRAFTELDDLKPEQVAVLSPDPDRLRPLLSANFVAGAMPALPLRFVNEVSQTLLRLTAWLQSLLRVARGRFGLNDALELLEEASHARAFDLDPADLPRLREDLQRAGVRWGLDSEDPRRQSIEAPATHTWAEGFDRLLLGIGTGTAALPIADRWAVPADVSEQPDRLGALGTWLRACREQLPLLRGTADLATWGERFSAILQAWIDPEDEAVAQARSDLMAGLESWREAGEVSDISPGVAVEALGSLAAASPRDAGQLDGGVSVLPLGASTCLPFRVIVVAGLTSQAFPRSPHRPAWDLLHPRVRPGDPEPRTDDRGVFLDVLLACRERLVLTAGFEDEAREAVPSISSCIDDLIEALEAWVVPTDEVPLRRALVTTHASMSWRRRPRGGTDLLQFDAAWLRTAQSLREPPRAPRPFWTEAAREEPEDEEADSESLREVPLEALLRFWNHPAEAWLRNACGIHPARDSEYSSDLEPFATDYLTDYQGADHLLDAELGRRPREAQRRAVRDLVPWGVGGDAILHSWEAQFRGAAALLEDLPADEPLTAESRVAVRNCVLTARGPRYGKVLLTRLATRSLKPHRRLRAWIELLVHAAAEPADAEPLEAWVLTRTEGVRLVAPPGARALLDPLIEGYMAGQTRPLPFHVRDLHGPLDKLVKDEAKAAAKASKKKTTKKKVAKPAKPKTPAPSLADEIEKLARQWEEGETYLAEKGGKLAFRGREPYTGTLGREAMRWAEAIVLPCIQNERPW